MLAGASYNEIALVLFLLAIVVIAPKVGRIGEIVGGLFAGAPRPEEDPDKPRQDR